MNKIRNFRNDDKKLNEVILPILNKESEYSLLSDEELRLKSLKLKEAVLNGVLLDSVLIEAFALFREAAKRTIGLFAYPSQLKGAYVLHNGDISWQATGSGKTLTAVIAAYLNALKGKGVHIITTNEYLARRDFNTMKPVFDLLGISVGLSLSGMSILDKKQAYSCDITYTTSSELGFDYLRDNMVYSKEDKVLRGLNYAIIDEVDSILVDDACTPLIISGKTNKNNDDYLKVDSVVRLLDKKFDLEIDDDQRSFVLTSVGISKLEKLLKVDNLYGIENSELNHLIRQAIVANFMMKRDVDYIIKNNEVMIVDPSTGRVMEGRRWSNGLHQAIEAKEGVRINGENKTVASITFQNFFRQYNKLAGMSGTCLNLDEEFLSTYNMRIYHIKSANKAIRVDDRDIVFKDKKSKYEAILRNVIYYHMSGRPILIGTGSVSSSMELSKYLSRANIKHNVLNAKDDEYEAQIIANAGKEYAVTIATNMAGRGSDIKLSKKAFEYGGLVVIGAERFYSKRVDDQLRGRSGRQGDPGLTVFFSSLEDDLYIKYGNSDLKWKNYKKTIKTIDKAQELCESEKYDARASLLEYDNVLSEIREIVYAYRDELLDNDIHKHILNTIVLTVNRIVKENKNRGNRINRASSYKISDEIYRLCNIRFDSNLFYKKKTFECVGCIANVLCNIYTNKLVDFDMAKKIERNVSLKLVDMFYSEFIGEIEQLKNGISLRSYSNLDIKKEFKNDVYSLFERMLDNIDRSMVNFFINMNIEYK